MKTFLALLALGLFVNLLFAGLTMVFFHGQIEGASTFVDYIHYAIGSLTTAGTGGIVPTTAGAKLWTSMYILVVWVYIIYLAVNHISNIRFGRFG
jgi:hypothetical protein